ncbi:hypothetical protein THASP1DRAFT_26585 [Thamnocephalis sphaerospora]|uniref:Tyr recombinase domain-containing protein n=1 Tax=Thamnocephalis sphaerospora TaxID=78915 RepID=A0A4V1IVQ1_9FUNG|nr:hypothetical protein THASP1DRAFT_26585 [Thamnocephalis sphaerospora]|eukprot:RKP04839.1 hypothetical protein THASP1DRAFT_26585 [Thamnocephalis sphaerospora]
MVCGNYEEDDVGRNDCHETDAYIVEWLSHRGTSYSGVSAAVDVLIEEDEIPDALKQLEKLRCAPGKEREFVRELQKIANGWLRSMLSTAGLSGHYYTCHSFRRGGASAAFEAGVPAKFVRLQGDWQSDVYLRYIQLQPTVRARCANLLGNTMLNAVD